MSSKALTLAAMNSEQLGIDLSWLMSMPAEQRADLVQQKRIKQYRSRP
jgi:hypothetical protein